MKEIEHLKSSRYLLVLKLWIWRYIRFRDLARCGVLLLFISQFVLLQPSHPRSALIGLLIFCTLWAADAADVFLWRRSRDKVQAEVIWALFSQMNREVFSDDSRTRFTLFVQSPFRSDLLVPWYRFFKGAGGPVWEAMRSKAHYRKGEGLAGLAWDNHGKLLVASMPTFEQRSDLDHYYEHFMGIDRATVRDISDTMVSVRTIIAYGFLDAYGKLLGVLSLDFDGVDLRTDSDNLRIDGMEVDANSLALLLRSIASVLNAFSSAERIF